jgi:hypothetical protein
MSQKTVCDYCGEATDVDCRVIRIDSNDPLDVCNVCWVSPVILSEQRRTRTRKPAVKRGRPRGKKTEAVQQPLIADQAPE